MGLLAGMYIGFSYTLMMVIGGQVSHTVHDAPHRHRTMTAVRDTPHETMARVPDTTTVP